MEGLISDGGINMKLNATLGAPGEGNPSVPCAIVNYLRPLDLLLLKIRPDEDEPPRPVVLGRAEDIADEDTVFSSGFHGDQPFKLEGTVVNRAGPVGVGYLWTVDMVVAAGQSGSPVYLSDGAVIGILKGSSDTAAGIGYMIPVDLADPLIAHLRIAELDRQVELLEQQAAPLAERVRQIEMKMADLSANYSWRSELSSGRLVVTYRKPSGAIPQIKKVVLKITPRMEDTKGEAVFRPPLETRCDRRHPPWRREGWAGDRSGYGRLRGCTGVRSAAKVKALDVSVSTRDYEGTLAGYYGDARRARALPMSPEATFQSLLVTLCLLSTAAEPGRRKVPWDAHGSLATRSRSALVPKSLVFRPGTTELFAAGAGGTMGGGLIAEALPDRGDGRRTARLQPSSLGGRRGLLLGR